VAAILIVLPERQEPSYATGHLSCLQVLIARIGELLLRSLQLV